MAIIKRILFRLCAFIAIITKIDCMIAKLGETRFPYLNRFIPERYRYKIDEQKNITRKGVNYQAWLSDEIDWQIFSNYNDFIIETVIQVFDAADYLVVLDIGANCGRFSLELALKLKNLNRLYKIYAFEPNPSVYKRLVYNLGLNKNISQNIILKNIGVGDKNKTVELQAPFRNRGAGSMVRNYQNEPAEKFSVEIISIDDFVENNRIAQVDLIKIDIEGYEPLALKGAEKTIAKFFPTIFIEIILANSLDNGFPEDYIYYFFKNKGYHLYLIDEETQSLIDVINIEDFISRPSFNLLCSKKEIFNKNIH